MDKRPIVEALQHFQANRPISMHVPGHKHGMLSHLPAAFKQVMAYDATELTGLDDLHHPTEAIAEAQQLLAETYQASKSFFLVNGSTVGNLAMVYATCQRGDTVLVQRNAHKSVFHALELVGVVPIFLSPDWDEQTKTSTHVSFETVQEAVERFPEAKAILLTNPTYYGVNHSDLQRIIAYIHEQNMVVLVDEAHGAHFIVHESMPPSAITLGADIVVQSAHKTLPAMTMASFLHIREERVDVSSVQHYLHMLQSSSPSYLLLASLDDARHYVATYTEMDWRYFQEVRAQLMDGLQTIERLHVVTTDDPLKLLLRVRGIPGPKVLEAFENQQLYSELADSYQVLWVLPLLKRGQSYPFSDIRKRVKQAVDEVTKGHSNRLEETVVSQSVESISTLHVSYEDLRHKESEWVTYPKALGRIAATPLIPYPPGIPLWVKGEKITVQKLTQLADYIEEGASIQGEHRLAQKEVRVIKEE